MLRTRHALRNAPSTASTRVSVRCTSIRTNAWTAEPVNPYALLKPFTTRMTPRRSGLTITRPMTREDAVTAAAKTFGLDLPDYPWEAMAPYVAKASQHPDGVVNLSIGT